MSSTTTWLIAGRNDTELRFPLNETALVEEYFEKISNLRSMAIVEAGRLLQEFKDETRAGDWGPLLKRLGWSPCDRFVRAYRVFGDNKALLSAANLRHIPQWDLSPGKPSTP